MNERIKEIALQAGGSHYPEVNTMQLEKFADMIIRECADIAIYNGCGDFVDIRQKLFDHFGIEQ